MISIKTLESKKMEIIAAGRLAMHIVRVFEAIQNVYDETPESKRINRDESSYRVAVDNLTETDYLGVALESAKQKFMMYVYQMEAAKMEIPAEITEIRHALRNIL